jgi:D-alanyl-D-alanine carboxypeptidase
VLDTSADGHGLTATLLTPAGTWSGASGMATATRAMLPTDQMAIASITKTIVAAQVMQLIEAGELNLDDLAADHLPPDLGFDTNGARVVDLLSMRSGIPQYVVDDESLVADPLHVWTAQEKLATVGPERGPVGQDWEYTDTNYLLLGLIIEQVTGRSVAEVLRGGVLAGDRYERLIYQPDELPTEPMALTIEPGATAEAFENGGGYLPSLAMATMFTTAGGMASDSASIARWFRGLCAGEAVSPASLDEMTDFGERPGYGLGLIDRSGDYWPGSGALGHKGSSTTVALCFQDPVSVVVVLANNEHDVDTLAGELVRAAVSAD